MSEVLRGGAAVSEITPTGSIFLAGYPHVQRDSTGVHDPLLCSALYLDDGRSGLIFLANDIIHVPRASAHRVRARIAARTGVGEERIMVTATHTHSGPKTVDTTVHSADRSQPAASESYVSFFEDRMVEAAVGAVESARPVEAGLALADATGVGTNRRDPAGPADPEAPVLVVREAKGGRPIAAMAVYSMHPTVLHEDSTLVSGDFPGLARAHLQRGVLGAECAFLFHNGTSGNQSPRHSVKANTFEEADRLGRMFASAVERAVGWVRFERDLSLGAARSFVDLPRRELPSVESARAKVERARAKLDRLRESGAGRAETRTAEVDWFGAERTLILAEAEADGRLERDVRLCMPAEVQVLRVGRWRFVGWPGEVFVEYGLELKRRLADSFAITLANGSLHGYIVTRAAAEEGGYEASNAVFDPSAGDLLVETAERLAR